MRSAYLTHLVHAAKHQALQLHRIEELTSPVGELEALALFHAQYARHLPSHKSAHWTATLGVAHYDPIHQILGGLDGPPQGRKVLLLEAPQASSTA